jgi:hypothetical protein
MDEETYQRLDRSNSQLFQLCCWLNKKRDIDNASRLIPITDDLTVLVAELSVTQH